MTDYPVKLARSTQRLSFAELPAGGFDLYIVEHNEAGELGIGTPDELPGATPMNRWIKRFEAFARSKPADEEYIQYSGRNCALAQFGFPMATQRTLNEDGIPSAAYEAAVHQEPFTFGALADRLSALIEDGE